MRGYIPIDFIVKVCILVGSVMIGVHFCLEYVYSLEGFWKVASGAIGILWGSGFYAACRVTWISIKLFIKYLLDYFD